MQIKVKGKVVSFVVEYGIDGYLDAEVLVGKLCAWHKKKGILLKGGIDPSDNATGISLVASREKDANLVKQNLEWAFGKKKSGSTARQIWKFDNDNIQIKMGGANKIVLNSKDPKDSSIDVYQKGKVVLRHPISVKAANDYKEGWVLFLDKPKVGVVAMLIPESRKKSICQFGKFIGESSMFPLDVDKAAYSFGKDGSLAVPKPCPKKGPIALGYMDTILANPIRILGKNLKEVDF